MMDYHGAFKPDGMRRTYPNVADARGRDGRGIQQVERARYARSTT